MRAAASLHHPVWIKNPTDITKRGPGKIRDRFETVNKPKAA
jgi:hypothetical protein